MQPTDDCNEIFSSVRPQIKVDQRGKVYTPMHMTYHLVKYCQENSENIESVVKGPLEGRQMTLQQMAIGETCGYEITLLVLSQMFQTPILVICADMLWLSQSVKPIDCPVILVQKLDGKFLGT